MERSVERRVFFDDDGGVDGDASHRTSAMEQRRVAVLLIIDFFPEPGEAPLVHVTTGGDPGYRDLEDANVILGVGRQVVVGTRSVPDLGKFFGTQNQ